MPPADPSPSPEDVARAKDFLKELKCCVPGKPGHGWEWKEYVVEKVTYFLESAKRAGAVEALEWASTRGDGGAILEEIARLKEGR